MVQIPSAQASVLATELWFPIETQTGKTGPLQQSWWRVWGK